MQYIDPKDPAEAYAVEFDFSSVLDSISSATVTVSVIGGTDVDASELLLGMPQISSAKVFQRVHGGVGGCIYKLRCEATDGASIFATTCALPVRIK